MSAYLWFDPEDEDFVDMPGSVEQQLAAAQMASFCLWALSGRKYTGKILVTERYDCPCRSIMPAYLDGQLSFFPAIPYLSEGVVVNQPTDCGCSSGRPGDHKSLRLRHHPVHSVSSVTASDGEVLDPGTYQIIDRNSLEGAPGSSIHACGLTVVYTYGTRPPAAGRIAAKHLAEQFLLGWSDSDECTLPQRVTSVSRQGVTYSILDDQAFLDDLRTGVYTVDLWLRAVNPDKARRPARVFTPDIPRGNRRTS